MAPHATSPPPSPSPITRLPAPSRPAFSPSPPRLLILGAGNRGTAYASAIATSTNGLLVSVIEPIAVKRNLLGRKYIWGAREPVDGESFRDWREYVAWEIERRRKEGNGEEVPEGVDGVFICVQDRMHRDVVLGLATLGLHVLCEKPLAVDLEECLEIYRAVRGDESAGGGGGKLFGIGHVLRYSPHNMLLRKLLLEERAVGDVMAVNHTEPVGWWHFTHSYVRYASLPSNSKIDKTDENTAGIGEKNQRPRRHSSPNPATTWTSCSGSSAPTPGIHKTTPSTTARSPRPAHCNISPRTANPHKQEAQLIASPALMKTTASSQLRKSI